MSVVYVNKDIHVYTHTFIRLSSLSLSYTVLTNC